MKNTLYAGVNEYGYIFPATIRTDMDECVKATCNLLKIEETENLSKGVQVIEYVQDGFFASMPLKVEVVEKTKVTVVKGWKAGETYVVNSKPVSPILCPFCGGVCEKTINPQTPEVVSLDCTHRCKTCGLWSNPVS
jgi:hypothetical protein